MTCDRIYLGTSEATDVWGGNPDDLGRAGASLGQRIPADFTADLGLRLDTYISI